MHVALLSAASSFITDRATMDPVMDVLRAVVVFRSGALAVTQAQLVDILSKAFGSSDTEEGLIILGMVVKVRLDVIRC
jgi:hypothetical protein